MAVHVHGHFYEQFKSFTKNSGNVQSVLSVTEHVANMKDKRTLLNRKTFNIITADSLNFCKNTVKRDLPLPKSEQ